MSASTRLCMRVFPSLRGNDGVGDKGLGGFFTRSCVSCQPDSAAQAALSSDFVCKPEMFCLRRAQNVKMSMGEAKDLPSGQIFVTRLTEDRWVLGK